MQSALPALLTFLCLQCGPVLGAPKTKEVTTVYGKVEGGLSTFGDYYEFTGMRYGIPIKFRAPAEPLTYSGVFKADVRSVACAQPERSLPFVLPTNNEDCLVINVFTPSNFTQTSSLPVMVFIHGGDFDHGSSTPAFYGPRFLVSQGVIVVSFNYRLNVYAFLNLGLKEAPGNAGLKDMRAALRWVQNNIVNFGGNPKNVTVFGHGAGGTSAIYLTLSPTTKGLFQRIIVDSGIVFTKDSYDPEPIQTAEIVAKKMGSKANSPKELFDLFNETSIEKVMESLKTIPNSLNLFTPSLEAIYEDEEPFLIDTPYNILATGLSHSSLNAVPVLIGHTTSEVLLNMVDIKALNDRVEAIKKGDYSSFLHRSINVSSTKEASNLVQELKETYLGNRSDYEGVVTAIFNFETDFLFTGPMSLFCDIYTNNTKLPVYSYLFEYIGGRNLGRQMLSMNSSVAGTTHFDELYYLMELESSPLPMDDMDAQFVGVMTTLWTSFAKHGNPTPPDSQSQWSPHPYKLLLSHIPQYVGPITPERDALWRSIYFRYGSDIRRDF